MDKSSTELKEAEAVLRRLTEKNALLENEVGSLRNFVGAMSQDLERDIPSFQEQTVWETGIYEIPDTDKSWYFNPSLMMVGNKKLLVARHIWMNYENWQNRIVFFGLNGDKIEGEQVLQMPMIQHNESFEDPRCFSDGKRWWLSMVNFIQGQTYGHQIVVALDEMLRPTKIYHPKIGNNGSSIYANEKTEKNWQWFFCDGKAYVVYFTVPHVVYEFDWYGGAIERYETPVEGSLWMHGEPRGGTPPVRVGDYFYSFFHSFTPWRHPKRRYHCGAYCFEARPPFRVVSMSTYPILSASSRDGQRDPLPIVIFPGGALLDQGEWLVAFGVNDLRCGWIRIPHTDLLELLKPLDPKAKSYFIPDQKSVVREPILVEGKPFA